MSAPAHITGGSVISAAQVEIRITGGTYSVSTAGIYTFAVVVKNGSPFAFTGSLNASHDTASVSATDLEAATASRNPDFTLLVHSQGSYSNASLNGDWTLNTESGVGTLNFSGGGVD